MKTLREWATPLTIGSFLLVAITGLLMFFHFDTGLNKTAHEWIGLVMVGAALLHAFVNFAAIKKYFRTSRLAKGLVAFCLVLLLGSFFSFSGTDNPSPPVLAMRAVLQAPLSAVAALTGRTLDQTRALLEKEGFVVSGSDPSLSTITGGDRERSKKALVLLFGKA